MAGHSVSKNFTLNIYEINGGILTDCYQLATPPQIKGPNPLVYAVGSGEKAF